MRIQLITNTKAQLITHNRIPLKRKKTIIRTIRLLISSSGKMSPSPHVKLPLILVLTLVGAFCSGMTVGLLSISTM